MPTNPQSPTSNAAIDRLALGVDSPRGVEPAGGAWGPCICSDANPSSVSQHIYFCFDAEPSAQNLCGGMCGFLCFEAE